MKNFYEPSENNNFVQARKCMGICNLSNINKYTVYGPSAKDLLNKFSIRKVDVIKDNSFMTIMMRHNKFICECQIIKLSPIKYLVLCEENSKLLGYLKSYRKKYPLVTVDDTSKVYSFFSFHGDKACDYFKLKNSSNLYKVTRQGYTYFTMLTSSVNKFAVIDHFKAIGFLEINPYVRDIFLYNINVLTNLNNLSYKYKNIIISNLYCADNMKVNKSKKLYCVKQFEATKNLIITKKMPIYNSKRKKIGYVHNFYRINNKKFPFVLGIVRKFKTDKIALLKVNKSEVLIKEYQIY